MSTRERALRACAEWILACRNLGWEESTFDALEQLWWRWHDERGNWIAQPAASEANWNGGKAAADAKQKPLQNALQELTKREASEARDAWLPIESAPKDGTAIFVCYGPHYDTNGFLPIAVRWRNYHPNVKGREMFRDSTGAKVEQVTHWRPLPAPPMSAESKKP